jgi:nucleoside-diphosphate-sugar epimerase
LGINFQGYPLSKTLAEKAAWKFAEENNIDLITVIPTLMAGPSLTPDIPSSIGLAMALITGINKLEYIICCNFHFRPCSWNEKLFAPYLA